MKVAVAILNWNGLDLLKKFIPKIIKYTSREINIYVIDNNSKDESINFLQKRYPEIIVIKNKSNKGYANGYNEGLSKICADIFILLNSDVEVTENWTNSIIEEFKKNNKTAVIQPKILDYKNRNYFEYAGAGGGLIDMFGYTYCRGRSFWHIEKDIGQYNDKENILWASGCCFCIRSDVFFKYKGFDEDFGSYQEEIDLCWRINNDGEYNIKYLGDTKVYHMGKGSIGNSPKIYYFNFRNNLYMLIKNLPKRSIYIILIRLLFDMLIAISFLFKKEGKKKSIYIIKAHLKFIRDIPKFYKKRKESNSKFKRKYYSSISIILLYLFNINKYRLKR